MPSKSSIIAAVEIGTSKVAVLIGQIDHRRSLNIIGLGQCASRGVLKGSIVDYKAASDCLQAAILAAEDSARVKVDGVFLASSGGHLDGFHNDGRVTVSSADNTVDRADMERVCALAIDKELPADRMIVHTIRRNFRIDGRSVHQPEHLVGRALEVGYWIVHGDVGKLGDAIHLVNGFNLKVHDLILSSLASGTMVTTSEERLQGCLVIDIGAGAADYVLYRDGCIHSTGVVPVGGAHLTNDLSLGLRISTGQAENLKLRHGRALAHVRDRGEKVWLNGDHAIGDRLISLHSVEQITAARSGELFEVIKRRLGSALEPDKVPVGVLLTGGGSRLPEIDGLAARVFNLPARRGEPPVGFHDELRRPEFVTVLGLLHYGLQHGLTQGKGRTGGFWKRFRGMFSNA